MSYNYATYVTALANVLVISEADANFVAILPRVIEYAEQRIYRELDLLQTTVTSTVALVASTRTTTIPASIVVVNSANVITPAATLPDAGVRNPMQRVSLEFLNYTWPNASSTGVPAKYAILDDTTVILAPTPDAAYKAEFYGVARPTPLSVSNTTTILTQYLPDLFLAASCVFGFGWQRDFGGQSENPQTAQSWETQYTTLRQSAMAETARIKAQSQSWQPFSPAPLASPERGA